LSLSIETKKAVVEEIVAGIGNAQTMVLAEYRGISVASMTELRANARKEGVYLRVLKNTLARRAVEGTSFAGLAEHMVGPLVYAASEDAVAAAKVLHQFSKKDEKLIIKAGSYDGAVMDATQVGQLAAIPSREELLSKLLFLMQAPLSGMARGMAALAEKKAAEEASA
jgi:ribosomal protein L10